MVAHLLWGQAVGGSNPPSPTGQARWTRTSTAYAASERRSPRSLPSTSPPGSAIAMTRASTAEPFWAWVRSDAARRAMRSGTSSAMSHVFRKRFTFTSEPCLPVRHSTRTTDGTTGGQSPVRRKARIFASESVFRRASPVTPPESKTSLLNRPARDDDVPEFLTPTDRRRQRRQGTARQPPSRGPRCIDQPRRRAAVSAAPIAPLPATVPTPGGDVASLPHRVRREGRPASSAYA